MNIPKIRLDVWVEAEEYNRIVQYAQANGHKTISKAMQAIISEWRRFKMIALKLQDAQREAALSKAVIIKDEK